MVSQLRSGTKVERQLDHYRATMNGRAFFEASVVGVGGSGMSPSSTEAASGPVGPPRVLPDLPTPASPEVARELFPGFTSKLVPTRGALIHATIGGEGPPLLLLHGHPETHVAWHKVAGSLARHFTVVLTDLRGYGDSSKPDGGERHVEYSARAMAQDQVEVMRSLGFDRSHRRPQSRGAKPQPRDLGRIRTGLGKKAGQPKLGKR